MSRLIDLIRASALPSTRMHAAARGGLTVPPAEMIEILVYLASHHRIFGQQARLTLAGWDEVSSVAVASDPGTPREVLEYLVSPDNLRPCLLSALIENPSVPADSIIELAASGSREIIEAVQNSRRGTQSPAIQNALASNPNLKAAESAQMGEVLASSGLESADSKSARPEPNKEVPSEDALPPESAGADGVLDEALITYLTENATEISAQADRPFRPIGDFYDEPLEEPAGGVAGSIAVANALATGAPTSPSAAAAARKAITGGKKPYLNPEGRRDNTLQKIAKMDIKGRIQLAMKGSKEERSILVRDGTKIVALAVLESPKITDGEVENFAGQKNVLEAVLRGISMKRRFAKNYTVLRNLIFNPRTPLDTSLGLLKNLLLHDLKNLAGNKEVSETIRKLALKMFKQKMDVKKEKQ